MIPRAYTVVDVFTHQPLRGNPVAVVLDAVGLDSTAMQAIARWTNLSETTFVLPPQSPEADYRLRIFTPRRELPFAGHPTLGSAHALLESGRVSSREGRLVQECGVGFVTLHVREDGLAFELPPAAITPLSTPDIDELEALLGGAVRRDVAPALVNVGPTWIVAQLADAASVLALQPDFARCAALERRLQATGLSLYGLQPGSGSDIEVRSFAPSAGVDEDPVCGSGNGSVAAFRQARGQIACGPAGYLASQGCCVGRDGKVIVQFDAAGRITLGGTSITCVTGVLRC